VALPTVLPRTSLKACVRMAVVPAVNSSLIGLLRQACVRVELIDAHVSTTQHADLAGRHDRIAKLRRLYPGPAVY